MLKTLKEENTAMQDLVIDVTRVIEILRVSFKLGKIITPCQP